MTFGATFFVYRVPTTGLVHVTRHVNVSSRGRLLAACRDKESTCAALRLIVGERWKDVAAAILDV